jgi:hypothetical protein
MGNDPILRLSQSRVLNLYTMVTIGADNEIRTRDSCLASTCVSYYAISALIGRPGEIRTPNLKFRRLAFYPVELRADIGGNG